MELKSYKTWHIVTSVHQTHGTKELQDLKHCHFSPPNTWNYRVTRPGTLSLQSTRHMELQSYKTWHIVTSVHQTRGTTELQDLKHCHLLQSTKHVELQSYKTWHIVTSVHQTRGTTELQDLKHCHFSPPDTWNYRVTRPGTLSLQSTKHGELQSYKT